MGNKVTVEVTEQTLYNIDILEDETTVVTVEIPQDIVTVEVSQFTVSLELYNSDNDVEGQPVYAKSGSDFTLRSFTDDQKTVDISHAGPSNELIQVKLPDTGIRVQDGFVISTDSDDTANIVFNGSTIDVNGVDDLSVNNLTAGTATVTTGTVTTLDGTNLDYTVGNITTVNSTTTNSTTVNADLVTTDAVQFDLTAGVTPQVGQLAWNDDDGTLEFKVNDDVTLQIGQENLIHVKNLSGGALNNGDVVYVTGASGSKITVDRADSSHELSSSATIAVMTQDLNNNGVGYATTGGLVRGLNTSMFLEGKALYLESNGGYTDVKPLTPNHLVPIGWVVRSHASEGSIFVHINNGQELEELHDVLITTISDRDLLQWNEAQSYWENVEGTTSRIDEGTNLYYTRARVEGVLQTYDGNFTANNATITNNISSANIAATVGNITTVNATDVNTTNVTATLGTITNVNSTDISTTNVDATLATVTTGNIVTVNSTTVNTTDVNATTGAITTVNATDVNTTDLSVTGTATIATGDITTVNATTVNTNTVNGSDIILTGDITARDATLSRDVVIGGNLTVNGTTTTVNTETLEVADNNIVLNSNHTGTPTQDAGLTIERGSEDDGLIQWNETSDKFEVKVGANHAVFVAETFEGNLTATQATITTGGIATVNATTVNSTDVNTTNVDATQIDTVDLDATGTLTAPTGDITTVNATDINTTDAAITGTATIATADVTQLNTNSIDVAVITGLQGLTATGNIVAQRFNGTWGNFTNLVNVGSLDVGGGDLTVDIDGNLDGTSATLSGTVSGETVRASYLREQVAGNGILVYDDVEFNDVVTLNNTTNSNTIRVSDDPDDFNNKTKYGAFITPDGVTAQTLWSDRAVNLATESGDVRIGSRINDTSTGSLETLGQNKANAANLVMYGDGSIVWNNTGVDPDVDVSLSIDPTGHHLVIDSAEGLEIAAEIRGDLIPRLDLTYDLGSPTKAWHSAYIGPGSLYIDGHKVLGSDAEGQIDITTDDGQNLNIFAGANGPGGDIIMGSAGGTTSLQDATINLTNQNGTVNVLGTLEAPNTNIGDLEINSALINQTTPNQNLEIRTDGTGYLHANVADLYVGPLTGAVKIDESSISATAGTLTVTGNLTGDVTGTVSDISNHTTSTLTEGSNLYYTDGRVQSVIDTNTAGFITDYTVTQSDVTQHQAALAITESQITDLTHYTNAQAITAIEGEATLDLTGDVTIAQDLDVTGLIKVNDGYILSSFNPFFGTGLPATAMDTTIMGVGQQNGYAGMTVRSRGEHDWGLSGFGIPPQAPRSLLALQTGRLDGSSDDYLNNADNFASVLFNPYSGFKTGAEWLTPSVELEAVTTEDHSSSGMGAKLVIHTTENGNFAGSQAQSHANKSIEIQGTTISTSDKLKIDDDVEITGQLSSNGSELSVADNLKIVGSGSSNTVIGDSQIVNVFDTHGFKITADDTNWAGITLEEYVGAGDKPVPSFSNATVAAQVIGGTPSAKTNVVSGKRLLTIQALAANETDGTLPTLANFRIKGETTEDQTLTNRGTELTFESTANGSNSTTTTLKLQGNQVTVNGNGDGYLNSGGDLYLDDDVKVTGTLNVDGNTTLNGNVTLGDANTDVVTATGKLKASNGFRNTVLDTNTANYLANVLGIVEVGDQGYISDGNGGTPCMAFYDGSNWKRMHAPTTNISST